MEGSGWVLQDISLTSSKRYLMNLNHSGDLNNYERRLFGNFVHVMFTPMFRYKRSYIPDKCIVSFHSYNSEVLLKILSRRRR